jgi:hypothetical protein
MKTTLIHVQAIDPGIGWVDLMISGKTWQSL